MRFSLTTFLFQTVNFLTLVWVLRRFLFRPVQKVVDQRRKKIEEAMAEAERSRAALATVDGEIERRRADAAAAIEKNASDARQQALSERQRVLDGARPGGRRGRGCSCHDREGARGSPDRTRAARRSARGRAGRRPRQERGRRRRDGRVAGAGVARHRAAAARRTGAFPRCGPAERGAAIRIVSAVPLDEEARARCRAALARLLGERLDVTFADDEALLAGAEIHFPHTVLRHSWREHLGTVSRGIVDGGGWPASPEGRHGDPAGLA